MQGVQDILVQGGNYVYPVLQNVLDIAAAMVPGAAKEKVDPKKVAASAPAECVKKVNSVCKSQSLNFTWANRSMIRTAGISGALAVGLGAYGAHVIMMNPDIPEEQKHSFRTANMYHFIGTLGLVASSLGKYPLVTGLLMATGTMIFCGSCYTYGMTGESGVKKFAPYGGTTLILAWLSLIL